VKKCTSIGLSAGSILLLSFCLVVSVAHAESIEQHVEQQGDGEPVALRLDLRFRYTWIEQSNKPKKVDVTTVRVAPGIKAKLSSQLKLEVELIHIDFIGSKRFNDDPAAASPYPLLPDPRYSGLNKTNLTWTPSANFEIAAGRQAVKVGNERHVSDNNFRQVPQLFDGAMARWIPIDSSAINVGYFPKLRSTFGQVQQAKLGLFEFAFNPLQDVSASLYAFRHQPAASFGNTFLYGVSDYSNVTYGATTDASFAVADARMTLTGEMAHQRGLAGGSLLVAANYYRVGLGATVDGWTLRADHENRGSNSGRYGFQTVLSDYYAYNGNSLVFFATPTDGLRDTWLTLRWERGRWTMLHEYRWFRSDFGGKNYGRELDLNFTYKWNERWYTRAQWAHYRSEAKPAADIDKVWITLGFLLP
jgi:hypothetical protein